MKKIIIFSILMIFNFGCQVASTKYGCPPRPTQCWTGELQCHYNSDGCESCGCIQKEDPSKRGSDTQENNPYRK